MPGWITGLLIAVGLVAVAIALIVRTYKWKKRVVSAQGVIVEFDWLGEGTGRSKAPVIEFRTN